MTCPPLECFHFRVEPLLSSRRHLRFELVVDLCGRGVIERLMWPLPVVESEVDTDS